MKRLSFSSLRARLLVLVLLAVVPALALILYTAAEQRRLATVDTQNDALRLTRLIAADQKRQIDETRQFLATFSYLVHSYLDDPTLCGRLTSDLIDRSQAFNNLGVAALDGEVKCSARADIPDGKMSGMEFFQRVISHRSFAIGNYRPDGGSGQPEIYFGYPVIGADGSLQAVVFATLSSSWFNRIATEIQLPEGASLIVMDSRGMILAQDPDPNRWAGKYFPQSTLFQTISSRKDGTTELPGLDGVVRLFAFTPLYDTADSQVYVSIGISREAAFAAANQILTRNLIWLGAVAILAFAAAWLGGELFILRRIRALLKGARGLMAGEWKARTGLPYGSGELSELARVFDQMADMLEQREIERKQAEAVSERSRRNLAALNTVTARISATLEVSQIFETLRNQLAGQFEIPAGAIYLYNPTRNLLQIEECWGWVKANETPAARFSGSIWPYVDAIQQNKAILIEDAREVVFYASWIEDQPDCQLLTVPLAAKGEVEGILDLFSPAEPGFAEDRISLFSTIGQQVGIVLQNARLFEQIRGGRERLKELSQRNLVAQEAERRHISRELHDEVGQSLTAIKVNLQSIQRAPEAEAFEPQLLETIAIIDRTLHQVRNLSLDLRPSLLDDLGVVAAIRWYLDRQAQRAGFEAQFLADPPEMRLNPELETTCFRVVQEAITNVVRHAQAKLVRVELRQYENSLDLTIRDDGVGFDVRAARERGAADPSLGLLGMEERVQLMGGQIEVRSDSTQRLGTEIRCIFPFQPRPVNLERRWKRRENE